MNEREILDMIANGVDTMDLDIEILDQRTLVAEAQETLDEAEGELDELLRQKKRIEEDVEKAMEIASHPESVFHQVFGDIRWSFVAVWINPLFGFGPDDEVVHVPSGAIIRTDWLYGWETLSKSMRCEILDRAESGAATAAYDAFYLWNSDRSDGESVANPRMQKTACCIAAALRDAFDAVTAEHRAERAIRSQS